VRSDLCVDKNINNWLKPFFCENTNVPKTGTVQYNYLLYEITPFVASQFLSSLHDP